MIVHLVTSLNLGGTERQLTELLGGLARRGTAQRLVCFRPTGGFLEEVRALGLEPVRLRLRGSLAHPGTVVSVARLAALLRGERATVLHCHDVYAVLVGVPAARLAGVPVLAARRDLGHHLSPRRSAALKLALPRATCVLANAATVAAQAEQRFGVAPGRLVVVPNGLDLARFDARAAAPVAEPVPPDLGRAPTILTVARMTHAVKGHDDLLAAAAIVGRRIPAARFLVVGDGPRAAELRDAAARLGVAGSVRFLGRRTDVPALLARADLVCHPARAEGLPNAILEAMAAARPIVATTAGGVPELARDGVEARLSPTRDPVSLAAAIVELLGDPAGAAGLGRAARARVEREHTTERLVERVQAVYRRMVAGQNMQPQHDQQKPYPAAHMPQ